MITTIERGGAENQLLVLAREQVKSGKAVSVLFLKGAPDLKYSFEGIGAEVYESLKHLNFFLQIFRFRAILNDDYDIIHAHLPRAELLCSLRRKKDVLVVSRHNSEPFFPLAPRLISMLLSRFVEFRSIKIIAISRAVETYLLQSREVSYRQKLCKVLYGSDSSFAKNLTKLEFERPNKETLIIGTVARLVHQKDYPTLLKAIAEFRKINNNFLLVCIGDGPLENMLKDLCADLGITDVVLWIGKSSAVSSWMAEFDVFVLASRYEGFGLVLLEAMQSDLPIIAANNAAVIEVLGEKHPGLFQSGQDSSLLKALSEFIDSEKGDVFQDSNTSRLKLFTPELMQQNIENVYLQSIAAKI